MCTSTPRPFQSIHLLPLGGWFPFYLWPVQRHCQSLILASNGWIICLSVYGSTALCWALASFSVSWSFTQSIGLLRRGISPSQGRYMHTGQNRIIAHRHPCLKLDSNPRSQCSSEWRKFMRPLWSAKILPLPGLEPRTVCSPPRNAVAIPTALSLEGAGSSVNDKLCWMWMAPVVYWCEVFGIPAFPKGIKETHAVGIACLWAEISTRDISNTKQEHYTLHLNFS
jgi:hypothetical protein